MCPLFGIGLGVGLAAVLTAAVINSPSRTLLVVYSAFLAVGLLLTIGAVLCYLWR